jgi:hypothetical protein
VRELLSGALAAGFFIVALHFARFWTESRDRLFVFFASAFSLLGISSLTLGLSNPQGDFRVGVYGLRLAAFVIILYGIYDKNRQ